jgi:hypothetical protein
MPKIPTYDQLGQRVKDVSPQIGLRADPGMVNSQLAAADFYAKAQDVAYEYYDADKKAEARSSMSAAENELTLILEDHNLKDTSTNAEDFDKIYTKKANKYITDISNKYSLRANDQKVLVGRLHNLSAGKQQDGRNVAFGKQQAIRGVNSAKNMESNIRAMTVNLPGTPLHNQALKNNEDLIARAFEHGTIKYLPHKNMDSLNLEVENKTFSIRVSGASTTKEIEAIRSDLKKSKLPIEKIITQEGRLKTQETAVINNTIADIVTSATVQQDFDGVDPDTVISEEERLVVIDKYLKGDYSSNLSAKEKYESLSVKDQARVNTALVTLRNNEQAQMKWEKYQKDNEETQHIENTLNESLPKVINGKMSAKEIYGLDLPGSAGLKAKNSLLAVSQNFVNNKLPTKTDLTTYALIEDQIQNGKITSPLTPFKVGEETKALSLIERLSSETGYISTDNYNVLTGDIASVKTSEGARNLAEFKTFIDGNAGTILGPAKLNVYNTQGKQRLYNWKVNMKANFDKGIKDGKSAVDLISPNSSHYIFTNQDFYIPTPMQIMQEQKDSLGTAMGVKQDFKPEQISPPIFNLPSKSVTFYDDREDKSITLGEQKYKSKKDFKLNSPEFKNWAKTYGTIWRKQPHPELGFPNGFSLRAYEMWLKSE